MHARRIPFLGPRGVVWLLLTLFLAVLVTVWVAGTGGTYRVVRVIDGDTILLENGESVRYLGIDAPETRHPTRGLECYGREATERNKDLVEGKTVRLEPDKTDRDRYGRLLRYVYVGGVFVNAKLIEEGYAYSSYYPPDTKYYQQLLTLELQAKREGTGLWSACPQ